MPAARVNVQHDIINIVNITLFIPAKNERAGMKAIMPLVNADLFCQILVVDGNSKDGTAEYARELGYEVYVQKKSGIRNAYIEAWPLIKGSHVITFSPDGNSDPADLPALCKKMQEGYDMVIASRYAPGAGSSDDDVITGFGNWLFNRTVNLLHHARYTDCMVIYRGYRTNLFYELDLDKEETYVTEKLFFTVMGCEPIISVRAAKRKLNITEIPSHEPPRIGGERKLQVIRWGGAYFLQFFREIFFWR